MTNPITLTDVFRRRDDVRYRIIDGEAVVIRQQAGEVLGINDVGARLLELVDGNMAVVELIDALDGEYEVERSVLERDVLEFLQEIAEAGLIETVEG
jgi:hypothetical protein